MTDAVREGQRPAELLQTLFQKLAMPCLIYFVVIPTMFPKPVSEP
jgi:hypothetical protein